MIQDLKMYPYLIKLLSYDSVCLYARPSNKMVFHKLGEIRVFPGGGHQSCSVGIGIVEIAPVITRLIFYIFRQCC